MSLLIDTPRWPWRGRLWAHMISDESLDELHEAARSLNLRYLTFGCDHYDVPDHVWDEACQRAELVDSRDIVRSLRATGLRVHGGKPRKAWKRVEELPGSLDLEVVHDWLGNARTRMTHAAVEVLVRPGECVVLHLLGDERRPYVEDLLDGPDHPRSSVCETVADGRYSLELILENPA
jgi:hypothetical protein